MDLPGAASAFSLLLVAELGDKSQLMAIALAHRFRPVPVLAGIFAAFLVLNLLATLVGSALGAFLPEELLLWVAGLLFLAFALHSWTDDGADEAGEAAGRGRTAFWASFTLLLLTELGDKTQLTMLALAARSESPWSVLVGGTLGLWVVSLLGVLVGAHALRRVPPVWIHRTAAVLFAAFGLASVTRAILLRVG